MVCQSTSALSHPPYHLTWPWAGLPWRLVSQQWGTTSKSKYCTHFHLSATASLTASNNLPLSLSWQDTWTKCTFQHRRGLFHTSHNKQYCVGTFAAQSIDFSNFPSLPLTSNINEDPGILNILLLKELNRGNLVIMEVTRQLCLMPLKKFITVLVRVGKMVVR